MTFCFCRKWSYDLILITNIKLFSHTTKLYLVFLINKCSYSYDLLTCDRYDQSNRDIAKNLFWVVSTTYDHLLLSRRYMECSADFDFYLLFIKYNILQIYFLRRYEELVVSFYTRIDIFFFTSLYIYLKMFSLY